jgi:NAD+ synthase/NAD+ synthase (glutamine-hydrolysing)
MLLMALSNKTGAIVLTTGNKSEMATGYATLYGDMAGGFAVIKDIYKTFVYRLCAWRNAQPGGPVIPDNILTRPPSAELKPDQCDQDSLPPYEVLDAIIASHGRETCRPRDRGPQLPRPIVRAVAMLRRNEYKRRQAPWASRHPARLRQGLALPHHVPLPRRLSAPGPRGRLSG